MPLWSRILLPSLPVGPTAATVAQPTVPQHISYLELNNDFRLVRYSDAINVTRIHNEFIPCSRKPSETQLRRTTSLVTCGYSRGRTRFPTSRMLWVLWVPGRFWGGQCVPVLRVNLKVFSVFVKRSSTAQWSRPTSCSLSRRTVKL